MVPAPTHPERAALSVRGLTKRYDDGTLALGEIDLEVPAGEFFGLLGPNGAGKTTLIGAITNLIRVTAGEVRVFGHPADSLEARRLVGVAEQEPNLDRFLTVREALLYHGGYFGMTRGDAERRAEEMIDVFDLRAKADVRAPKLSGGMLRRRDAGGGLYAKRRHFAATSGGGAVSALEQAKVAARPEPWRGLLWLSVREMHRVLKLWTQTTLAPVISSALFILVFGLSLSSRISHVEGFPYREFIVPGLIAMAMAQAAYSNNSSSIFQARSDRYIHDVLAAPIRPWQMNLGLTIGGVFRALLIGAGLLAVAVPLTGAPIQHPLALIGAVVLLVTLFGALGVIVGIYAETFDHHTFVNNIVILPLTFLGGVFYSVSILPPPWRELSHANPLFYIVNSVRYGFLGISDVGAAPAFAVTAGITAALVGWSQYLFATGRKLRP